MIDSTPMTQAAPDATLFDQLAAIKGVEIAPDEPLARHVTMGVGGPARWFVTLDSVEAAQAAIGLLRSSGVRWMVLGGGSNTFFVDAGFDGVILFLGRGLRAMTLGPGERHVTAGAGATLSSVMNFAKRAGLAGLEFAAGIPGTLGGALAGNAGTPKGDICSLVDAVEVIDAQGHFVVRQRGEFEFAYRSSALRHDLILRATLALCPDSPEAIQERITQALTKRGEQPIGVRTSGCTFKNPPGDAAGRMIDAVGLKGERVGGAWISERHANFILNDGSASSADICELVSIVRQRVLDHFGVNLELEIKIVGLDSDNKTH